jgi:hypothetical protein
MRLIVIREPEEPAADWTGRTTLALIDAVGWPLVGIALLRQLPEQGKLTGQVFMAVLVLMALGRARRAWFENEYYRFTTWRWGKPVLVLMAMGWLIRLFGTP